MALKSLKAEEKGAPVMGCDSIPFGGDCLDTLVLPDGEMQSMAERLNQDMPEGPNLEAGTPPATCHSLTAWICSFTTNVTQCVYQFLIVVC